MSWFAGGALAALLLSGCAMLEDARSVACYNLRPFVECAK